MKSVPVRKGDKVALRQIAHLLNCAFRTFSR